MILYFACYTVHIYVCCAFNDPNALESNCELKYPVWHYDLVLGNVTCRIRILHCSFHQSMATQLYWLLYMSEELMSMLKIWLVTIVCVQYIHVFVSILYNQKTGGTNINSLNVYCA